MHRTDERDTMFARAHYTPGSAHYTHSGNNHTVQNQSSNNKYKHISPQTFSFVYYSL